MKNIFLLFAIYSLLIFQPTKASNDSLLIYNYYYKLFAVDTFILYIDQKDLADSSSIYTFYSPCSLPDAMSMIPKEFYKVNNKSLLCFFHGDEDYTKITKDYMLKYLDTIKPFFKRKEQFTIISWDKKLLKRIGIIEICDPPLFKVLVKNGKIIQEFECNKMLYMDNFIQYNYVETQ